MEGFDSMLADYLGRGNDFMPARREKEIMGKASLPTVAVNRMVHGEGGAAGGPIRAGKHRNASAGSPP